MPEPESDLQRPWLATLALVALVLAAYLPALGAGWIWDDDSYVTANPLLDPSLNVDDALRLIWTPGATPQYYPLVFTSFLIESRLYGAMTGDPYQLHPFGFHLVNIALHAASAVLVWRILRELGVPGAWLAAALFAAHPMNVESVAWVTERKNVLALALGLAAVASWLRGVRDDRMGWCGLALALFVLGMLSKTTIAAVAPALVVIHVWRRDRLPLRTWAFLACFFAVGIPLGLHTAHVERTHVGAEGAEFALSFAQRLALAPRIALHYVWTFVWPSRLAFIYPRWTIDAGSALAWLPAALVAAALVVGAVAWRRGSRGPLALMVIGFASLFPALGFIDVYPFRYSYVADHFAYLATIPLAIGAAYALTTLARRLDRRVAAAGAALLVCGLAIATGTQTLAYRNEETLWRSSLSANPDAWMPASNLAGIVARQAGDAIASRDQARGLELAKESEALARAALDKSPEQATAWTNLSEALRLQSRFADALAAADKALALAPNQPDAHWRRGRLLELSGDLSGAIDAYRAALEHPDRSRAPAGSGFDARATRLDLVRVLIRTERIAEAIAVLETVVAEHPDDAAAAATLARCRVKTGDLPGARSAYRAALEAAPDVQFAVSIVPSFIEALLSPPSDADAAREASDAASWLNDRTGGADPLVMVLRARTLAALGDLEAARRLVAEARSRAADAPAAVRDEIERRAKEFDAAPPAAPAGT
ncbi:MAG: tetratricopeptide repeat protein [Phycisphaerales bacterium]